MGVVENTRSRLSGGIDRDRLVVLVLLAPLVVFFGVLWFVPLGYSVWSSLLNNPLGVPEFVGLSNYVAVLTSSDFLFFLWNSTLFAISTTLLCLLVGLFFALVVNRVIAGGGVLRTLMVFPYLLPTVVVVFLWQFLLDQNLGLVNRVLLDLGLISAPIAFFGNVSLAMPSIVTASVWKWGSFAFFIILANLQAIPDEYFERAKVQGASQWQQFRDITFPHLRGAILLILLVRGIWMFNKFDVIWLTTRGGPAGVTTTLPIRVYDLSIRLGQFGQGTALAVIMFLLLSVVGVVYFTVLNPEEEVTS
ncbi:carbohydrate ABC transporter permease (plasmid) [Halococcus morrhuae DSM 1307]|uniref:carbohydrate ABC transporter permease n=1 Tax=Halococcus morrhuae TaxID=2250 RepID=UPI0009B5CDF4|nr:sugar ABC transporter permease [Halococcus morrhuae]